MSVWLEKKGLTLDPLFVSLFHVLSKGCQNRESIREDRGYRQESRANSLCLSFPAAQKGRRGKLEEEFAQTCVSEGGKREAADKSEVCRCKQIADDEESKAHTDTRGWMEGMRGGRNVLRGNRDSNRSAHVWPMHQTGNILSGFCATLIRETDLKMKMKRTRRAKKTATLSSVLSMIMSWRLRAGMKRTSLRMRRRRKVLRTERPDPLDSVADISMKETMTTMPSNRLKPSIKYW